MRGGRTSLARALAAVGAAVLLLAFVAGYGARAVFDSDQFSNRASAALENQAVADEIGVRVADGLVGAEPNLVAVRPVLEGAATTVVRGGAFQSAFRAGVSDLHRAFFDRDQGTITFTLADIGATVRGAVQALDPKLADRIPSGAGAELLDEDVPDWAASLLQLADAAVWLPWALFALAVVCIGAALALASDRRLVGISMGVSMLISAILGLVALRLAKAIALGSIDDQAGRDALDGIWQAFLGDLATGLLLFAGCGAVIAAAASSLLRPVDLRGRIEGSWATVAKTPQRTSLRVLRAIALVVAGVLIALNSEAFISILVALVGLLVAYAGVSELMRMTIAAEPTGSGPKGSPRVLVAAGAVAAAILAAGGIFIGVGGVSQGSLKVETVGCNGSLDLCDRSYDEVATFATHNSMSAATYPNWLFAQQERGISDQLRSGVRGLLIDAHLGVETESGRIKTDLSNLDAGERATYEEALGPDALDAALRIRDRIVNSPEVGEPGVYLCHRFCELGAISIDRGFTEIRDFAAANPDEVVTVVIEDYVPPDDIADAAERTGLIDYVYEGRVGDPWPTLQEIIDSGGRVLMLAENEADEAQVPWYHPVYESLVQETPFSFSKPSQLTDPAKLEASCESNRGPADASEFLINHWIDTSPAPRPSNAAIVNKRSAILDRVHQCEEQRGVLAGLIAIDFYEEGDTLGAVSALNAER